MTTSTSVRLDKELLKKAKLFAIRNDTTLTNVIAEGIKHVLGKGILPTFPPEEKGDVPF